MLSLSTASRVDWRKGVHGRWTFLKTHSLQVLSAARKVNQEDVTSMPGAAAPGKYYGVPPHKSILYFLFTTDVVRKDTGSKSKTVCIARNRL